MPTLDGENLIITLDSGETNIDWIDVYSAWKTWVLSSPTNRGYPEAFRTTGGDPLNTLLNAGSYWFLRNDYGWRIKPPEEHITILAAGNLAPEDANIDMFVPTTGAYTTQILGLQPITQGFSTTLAKGVEHGLYGGGVSYDEVNGYAGTGTASNGHLIGTPGAPSNNQQDALTIAGREGLTKGYIIGDLTFIDSLVITGFTMYGQSKAQSTITIPDAATVIDTHIYNAKVTGILDGQSKLNHCYIEDLEYINGYIESCVLSGTGTITLGGNGPSYFLSCFGGEVQPATIDMGGGGQSLIMEEMYGEVSLENKTGSESCYIVLSGGSIRLDLTTVTNGIIHISGTGRLLDDSDDTHIPSGVYGSLTIINELLNTDTIADTVSGGLTVSAGMTVGQFLALK